MVVILLVFAVAGVGCGLLWEWLWTPPSGVVVDGDWTPSGPGLRQAFSGTGLFVVLGTGTGLVLGAGLALRLAHDERATLAAVALGAVLATLLMWLVGTRAGPPDPVSVARSAGEGAAVPGDLRVDGPAAFLALPAGALLGVTAVFLTARPVRSGLTGRIRG